MIIKNGLVLQFDEKKFILKNIRISEGKILEISNFVCNEDEEVFNADGMYITPGLIDAHSHLCVSEEGMGEMGDDCNDYSAMTMPYLETIDAMNPFDQAIKTSVRAGITSVCTSPGSDSVVGGICSTIELDGTVADKMIIKRKTALKCSFGENPKKAGYSFKSRMGIAYQLRMCFEEALDYRQRKFEAEKKDTHFKKDMGMENVLLVLNGEIPIHAHAHRADDICTAIRIAKEYEVGLVLIHCTDGIAICDYLLECGYPIILGPTMYPRTKLENQARCFETAGVLCRAGLKICITADHDVTPLYYLSVYAALSVQNGLDEIEGLKAITKNPAEVLGIDDRKGDLREGLDADIVVWERHPFDYNTKVRQVFLRGKRMI